MSPIGSGIWALGPFIDEAVWGDAAASLEEVCHWTAASWSHFQFALRVLVWSLSFLLWPLAVVAPGHDGVSLRKHKHK